MFTEKDIPYLSCIKYDFDDVCTFYDLVRFHRQYVDNDYPFWEWFNDHIEFGIIKLLN